MANSNTHSKSASQTPEAPQGPALWLGFRRSAIVEAVIFIALFCTLDLLLGDGTRFRDFALHPFWIPVLLISTQYGTSEAILTVALCSLTLYIGNLPEQNLDKNYYQYLMTILRTPILWVVTALILGETRVKHMHRQKHVEQELTAATHRETTIAEAYQRLFEQRDALQRRLAGNFHTALDSIHALVKLQSLDKDKVLTHSADFIVEVLKPLKSSIFLLKGNTLTCVIEKSWNDDDHFRREFNDSSSLFHSVVGEQTTLCCVNNEHEVILGNEGLLAGPITNPDTGKTIGMIKFEAIDFANLNLTTVETFRILGHWIGLAYAHATEHEEAQADRITNPETLLLSPKYFHQQRQLLTTLGKRAGFDVSQLTVTFKNAQDLPTKDRQQLAQRLQKSVIKALRSTDQAFDSHQDSTHFAIILPNTPIENAHIVKNHIRESLGKDWSRFQVTSKALHNATEQPQGKAP